MSSGEQIQSQPVAVSGEEFRAEMRAMQAALRIIEDRLNAVFAPSAAVVRFEDLPEDAKRAAKAVSAARARGFFWVQEFADAVGKHRQTISDLCNARSSSLKAMHGRKPYRIPFSEYEYWMRMRDDERKPGPNSRIR